MALKHWQVYKRGADRSLLEHLCRIRQIDPSDLEMDYIGQLHNPNLLPQMKVVRALIVTAVKEKWPVAIFGDYDADGTPAAAILASLCQKLGLLYEVYLPTRQTGYGLSESFIEPIADQAKLLITVDTGVTAVNAIKKLKELGVKVIVLDHHLPPEGDLPKADAIVDPFLPGSKYPFPNICGCTLAFKLAVALQQDFPAQITESFLKWQLDLVAISTVADMMLMRDENRPLVHFGLQVLKKTRRPGLMALLRLSGLKIDDLNAGSLGFSIGPRFNAAGRMGDNRPVYDLLMTTDPIQAQNLAVQIEELNKKRQILVETVLTQAETLIWQQNKSRDFVYLIAAADWPGGVVGLVAGKLAEKYYRPVIVGSRTKDSIRASARTVGDYPIIDGLTAASALMEQYGGHRQAAGLTVNADKWESVAERIKAHAEEYFKGILPKPVLKADDFLTIEQATLEQAKTIARIAPFGLGNPKPTFILRDVEIRDAEPIGAAGKHLRATLVGDGYQLPAIGFSLSERFATHKSNRADVAGYLTENVWNDSRTVQFQIIDFKHAGSDIQEVEHEI